MARIKVEVSARHCHLSEKHLDKLFGGGHKLKSIKKLSQPGQFAAQETITVSTRKGKLEKVRILGPVREKTQVEITMTESRKLGLNPPVRLSGDLAGSSGATLIGPAGRVRLKEGVIIAKRHIHYNPKHSSKIKLKNGQKVSVKTFGDRSVTFNDVVVRSSEKYSMAIHLDTDEGNASLPSGMCGFGELKTK